MGLVSQYIEDLITAGLTPQQIGVITPYNAQVNLLKKELASKFSSLEIGTVDGFQGREKEAIVRYYYHLLLLISYLMIYFILFYPIDSY